jgi:hypothetical protein
MTGNLSDYYGITTSMPTSHYSAAPMVSSLPEVISKYFECNLDDSLGISWKPSLMSSNT